MQFLSYGQKRKQKFKFNLFWLLSLALTWKLKLLVYHFVLLYKLFLKLGIHLKWPAAVFSIPVPNLRFMLIKIVFNQGFGWI